MKMGKVCGYARVSSADQNEDRQRIALAEAGVADENIYTLIDTLINTKLILSFHLTLRLY